MKDVMPAIQEKMKKIRDRIFSQKSKHITTIVIFCVLIGGMQGLRHMAQARRKSAAGQIARAKTLGQTSAPVKIIEYTDMQCPACAKGAMVLKDYVNRFPKKIYVEYHHFPLVMLHPHVERVSQYAECAARQNKFWVYHDLVFFRRQMLLRAAKIDDALDLLAREAALDEKELAVCLKDETVKAAIAQDRDMGKKLGVNATPTYFINGRMFVGSGSLASFLKDFFQKEQP